MRGQFKLIHSGYGFTKMFVSPTGITTWRCALNQSYAHLKCRAKCYTKQVGILQKVKQIGDHTHPKKIAPGTQPTRRTLPQQNGKKKVQAKAKAKAKGKLKPKPKKKVIQEATTIQLKANLVEELKKKLS